MEVIKRVFLAVFPFALFFLILTELFHVLAIPVGARPTIVLAFMIFGVFVGFVTLLRGTRPEKPKTRGVLVLFLIGLLLVVPFSFMSRAFGTHDVGSLLITVSENELGDMVSVGVDGFMPEIMHALVVIFELTLLVLVILRVSRFGRATVAVAAGLFLVFGPVSGFLYRMVVPNPAHALINAEAVVAAPVILEKPEQKKNLIVVYMESLERTYRDLPESKDAFQDLARLEDENLSFRNIAQAVGTTYTIGGLVGTQCGVPLMPRGAFNIGVKHRERTDKIPDATDFMGEVTCLGDILAAEGYRASYINGSDLRIFSKGDFFRSHGYEDVRGFEDYDGWQDEPRSNTWGMDDDLLFERVRDELALLAEKGDPFVLSTLTIGTHGPDAYLDASCDTPEGDVARMVEAIACTANHVEALIDYVDELGLADSTLIAVMSDHLARKSPLFDVLSARESERRNYVTVIGAGKGAVDRAGTMLDIYPTLLELMGYKLENGAAGLGTSLMSEPKTFSEREGVQMLNRAISYNNALQAALWSAD